MTSLILMSMGGTAIAENAHDCSTAPPSSPVIVCPDKKLTPGSVEPKKPDQEVFQHHRKRLPMPNSLRDKILQEYKLPAGTHPDYEIDHLIPLCLGGSNDPSNLWAQPKRSVEKTWNAEAKDRLERQVCDMACAGKLDISTAQEDFAKDWICAYHKYYEAVPTTCR
jgi:hypothetical protein